MWMWVWWGLPGGDDLKINIPFSLSRGAAPTKS